MSTTTFNISASDLKQLCLERLENITNDEFMIHHRPHHERPKPIFVWTLGLSLVTFINLSAVVGILAMRLMSKRCYDRILTFFVALGVGSLSGSAIFHLLPQAFGLASEFKGAIDHTYLKTASFVMFGVYTFFLADRLLNMYGVHQENTKSASNARIYQTTLNDESRTDESLETTLSDSPDLPPPHKSSCIHDHQVLYRVTKDRASAIATVAWMVIFGDGLHNFIDGVSIGASFDESILNGLSVSVAVICEEFPHEMGDIAILISAGMSMKQALVYNVLSAMTCYAGFIVGVISGNLSDDFNSYIFALAGGMFIYISIGCMMPEMKKTFDDALHSSVKNGLKVICLQCCGLATGLFLMISMARYGGDISFMKT